MKRVSDWQAAASSPTSINPFQWSAQLLVVPVRPRWGGGGTSGGELARVVTTDVAVGFWAKAQVPGTQPWPLGNARARGTTK